MREKRREIDRIAFSLVRRINAERTCQRPRAIARTARKHTLGWAPTAAKNANWGLFTRHRASASPLPSPGA
jgi:hypothetical protein